jgi:hypothetical protein
MKNIMKTMIALLMFSAVASAADWQYVDTNGQPFTNRGNNIFYDKASVVINGDSRKVWLKFHPVGPKASGPDSDQLWSIRCHDRQYKILVLMDGRGNDLAAPDNPYLRHDYIDIEPDTWMEDLLTQVCAH